MTDDSKELVGKARARADWIEETGGTKLSPASEVLFFRSIADALETALQEKEDWKSSFDVKHETMVFWKRRAEALEAELGRLVTIIQSAGNLLTDSLANTAFPAPTPSGAPEQKDMCRLCLEMPPNQSWDHEGCKHRDCPFAQQGEGECTCEDPEPESGPARVATDCPVHNDNPDCRDCGSPYLTGDDCDRPNCPNRPSPPEPLQGGGRYELKWNGGRLGHQIYENGCLMPITLGDGATAKLVLEGLRSLSSQAEMREALENARPLVKKWCHYQGDSQALFDQYLGPIDAALNREDQSSD